MAASPALIFEDLPGALPAAYTLPPGFNIRLDSIAAMFDGSGAGEDFYPCLAIYSQNGKLIGRFFSAQALAAGDTAEVTFAPFLRQPAAATPAGGGDYVFLEEQEVTDDTANQVIRFNNISQDYRHLVVEARIAIVDYPGPADLQVNYRGPNGDSGGVGSLSGVIRAASNDASPEALGEWGDDQPPFLGSSIWDILPCRDLINFAATYATITFKFPYYTLADRSMSCVWQAETKYPPLHGASSVPYYTVRSGGLESGPDHQGPINRITLSCGSSYLAAGTIASLYGIM